MQQLEHLTFREATARLGADPEPVRPQRRDHPSPLAKPRPRALDPSQVAVLSAALDLYRGRLMGDANALAYLAGRGFGRDLLDRLHVGYATGDELVPYLVWRNLPVASAWRVGLLDADGRERLAGRIVLPEIREGQPIWIIGRRLDPDDAGPKYLGLPGRKPLLGWETASHDLRGVCVVEGPLDWLALRQWGAPGLALCGTRLHPETFELLGRWQRLYLILDDDVAGHEATDQLAAAFGARVVRVTLPDGVKDPADLALRPDGAEVFAAAIRDAVDRHRAARR